MSVVNEPIGNASAMREALVKIRKLVTDARPADEVEIANICNIALSAPPRNCDVFDDPYDAADAWPEYEQCAGRRFQNGTCDGCMYSPARCISKWLFAEAKGGADE